MAEERKDLPAATSDNFAARARETLMTYLGRQGDPLDRGITLRDLVEGGIVAVREGFSLGGRGKLPIQPAPSLGAGGGTDEEKDPTPPPTPTGLTVTAGITNLIIEHDAPLYSQGHGHARTLVYGAKGGTGIPPVFADAVKIHEFTGTVSAYVTDPATTWHLWIKWVSVDGFASALPGGGINGVSATTGQDPAKVLQMLTGQITESQLYADLGERIDLIDGNGAGSVNARIETETTARADADGTLFAQYTVKIDNNGYVSGFGLASSANNAVPTSTFAVRADTFYIASPSGPGVTPALPFIVKTTAGAWGPAGVYIQEALIANATIGSAKIADAAIDDAKVANLSAAKLTAGDGTIGGLLKSSNYEVGSAGWLIHPNGTAEFAAAAIRGQLVASQIDSRGLSIKDDFGNVILAAGAALPPAYLPSDARKNLANLDWWKEGASIPWSLNGELNQLVQSSQVFGAPAGPRGGNDVVWYCEELSGNGEDGGGWNGGGFVGPLNKNKCYRFVVPIYRVAGSGTSYWGIQDIAQLNTDTNADNPYFCAMGLPVGRWFLFVGYVYPAGTTNASNAGSGVYDCATGALVQGGTSYNFKSNGSPGLTFRAYQYYASANAAQLFGRPLIECVDGTESSLREYFLPSATLNSAITIAPNGALSGGGGGQVTLPGMGVNTFRILTRGSASSQHPAGDPGIYKNEGLLAGIARSYIVGKINRTTGEYVQVGAYDVFGGAGDTAAAALNAIGSDFIVVVYSFDEPQNGRSPAFLAAMYRHGASRAVLGSPNFRYRSAYALIGIGACGEGNGAEIYQGAIDNDPAAWIDVGFSVVNGVLTGVSSATTPKSLSDYGYVGDLNATANQPDSTVNAGIASAATTAIWTGISGAGKPQDNATVGATIGTNLVGQFTPANSSTYIADAAIKSAHIENLAVNSAKINDLAVTAAKIADLAVTSAKIADASINSAKIGNLAVDSIHIIGEAVTTSRFGSANGYQRYWSGFTSYMPRYQVEDVYSTMYVPVRAGEQTLITVTYGEVSTGNIDERDGDGNVIASGPALISREPRIRINGGAPLTISGPHGSVRALYVATATETVRIDFSVFINAWGTGNYRVSTLIISAFTGRR